MGGEDVQNVVADEIRQLAPLAMAPYIVGDSSSLEDDAFLDRKPVQRPTKGG